MTVNSADVQEVPSEGSLDQACAWIACLRSDTATAADQRKFTRWLNRSVQNRRAFDAMTELWGDLGALAHMPIDELYPESQPAARPLKKADASPADGWNFTQWLLGGGLVAACLVIALWIGNQRLGVDAFGEQTFTTRVGETRSVALSDGSRVQLNTDTELRVDYRRQERRIQLLRGEAYFDVALQTARPFTVIAGRANIRVLGTRFNVERNPDSTRVSVTGGTVAVSETQSARGLRPESVKLTQNQKVSVAGGGLSEVTRTSAEEALDWTHGVLVFEQTPLAEALEELNRYLKVPAAAAPSVRDHKLSGTFELSDLDNTLKAIATALGLQQDHSNPNLTLLSPRRN